MKGGQELPYDGLINRMEQKYVKIKNGGEDVEYCITNEENSFSVFNI